MEKKLSKDIKHNYPEGKSADNYNYAMSCQIFHTDQLFLYSEKVLPGTKASAPHYHISFDEIVYILKGELCVIEGEAMCNLKSGDSVCFRSNSKKLHYLQNNTKEEAEFLVFRKSTILNDVIFE